MTADYQFEIIADDVVDVVISDPFVVDVVIPDPVVVDVVLIDGPRGAPGTPGQPGSPGAPGSNATVEFFTGILDGAVQDGANITFPLPRQALDPNNIHVYRNGLAEIRGLGFTATTTHITFTTPPLDIDVIAVTYQV